jgi:AhpD family alkylhydroperoxidase
MLNGSCNEPKELRIMLNQNPIYPAATQEWSEQRKTLAPKVAEAFKVFSESVFADGAIPARTKKLIAVAVAHVTQCPYCVLGHTKGAMQHGVTPEEIMEAIWIAAEVSAGAAYQHSGLALDMISQSGNENPKEEALR